MVENKYKTLKKYDIRKGLYPIRVTLTIWDDKQSKPYIDLYSGVPTKNDKKYKHNHFKITNPGVWHKIKRIIDNDLLLDLQKVKPLSEKAIEKQEIEEIELIKKDNLRLKKRLQNYSKLIKEYREVKLPDYELDIKEFEKKIASSKKENELQDFLSKKSWLLGLEYENSQPQKIGIGKRFDFYVEKYDGYADIIEIKKSTDELFNKNGKMSKILSDSIQQLIEYIDDAIVEGDSKLISKKLKINFLKPKGILIIGKDKNKESKEKIKNLSHYFFNLEILTYDDVLARAKIIIKNLKAQRK